MNHIKTLTVLARIQAGSEASFNALKTKYLPPGEVLSKQTTYIPLVRGFLATPRNEEQLKKSLTIIASKNVSFAQPFYQPRIVPSRNARSVNYRLSHSPLMSLKEKTLFYTRTLRRVITMSEAQWDLNQAAAINVRVTPRDLSDERAQEILKELGAEEKPQDLVIDGLLLGDMDANMRGEDGEREGDAKEEFIFFPFATEETVIKPTERGLRLQKENRSRATRGKMGIEEERIL